MTEDFACFLLSCIANARAKIAKTGHGPHSSQLVVICVVLLFVFSISIALFYVLFVCKCVLYCTALHCTALYCTVLYCTVLYWYCTALYCTVICVFYINRFVLCNFCVQMCTVLHCTALHCTAICVFYINHFVLCNFCVQMCTVLYYCHRVPTKLQFTIYHTPQYCIQLNSVCQQSVKCYMQTAMLTQTV